MYYFEIILLCFFVHVSTSTPCPEDKTISIETTIYPIFYHQPLENTNFGQPCSPDDINCLNNWNHVQNPTESVSILIGNSPGYVQNSPNVQMSPNYVHNSPDCVPIYENGNVGLLHTANNVNSNHNILDNTPNCVHNSPNCACPNVQNTPNLYPIVQNPPSKYPNVQSTPNCVYPNVQPSSNFHPSVQNTPNTCQTSYKNCQHQYGDIPISPYFMMPRHSGSEGKLGYPASCACAPQPSCARGCDCKCKAYY